MDRILKSKYKIQDKISDSPSHVTYRGAMVDSDKGLIIKIYRRQYLDSVLIKHLKKDIARLARLDCPLIPRLIDGDYGWQGFYFVREYADGRSLADLKLPLETETACEAAIGICQAVGAAHCAGIVHGSLTPENVFITPPSRKIKVADFGIKKAVSEPVEQRAKWLIDGSSAFSAPEVLLGESSTERSDIYQVGLLLLYMLSGETGSKSKGLAFAAETLSGKNLPASPGGGKLPKFLEEVIIRCTEKDPYLRFNSVKEVEECLRSKSVPDKRSDFMDMLEMNYTSAEEHEPVREEPPKPRDDVPEPGIGIFTDSTDAVKGDKISFIKWVLFSVWVAVAAGIIYSLINIFLMGE